MEDQINEFNKKCARLGRESKKFERLLSEIDGNLKEIGDIETWSRSIELDMQCIASSLLRK